MYYFKGIKDGQIIGVESKSANIASPDHVSTTKQVYDDFIASLPKPETAQPSRDLGAEIDDLKAELQALKK